MNRFNETPVPATRNTPRRGWHGMIFRMRTALLAGVALLAGHAAAADYVADPTWSWGTGRMIEDAFFGSNDQNYIGRALARFDNGDVVVAGTVPHASGYGAIGLVRYAENGTSGRVAWTNPGTHGTSGNQYVVYPGDQLQRIIAVRKVIVHENLMFVLADVDTYRLAFPNPIAFSGDGAAIYVFGADGSYKNKYLVDKDEVTDGSVQAVFSGGIATYATETALPTGISITRHLVYTGRKKVAQGNNRITYRRYTFTTAGTLTSATELLHPAASDCGPTNHCQGHDIAVGGSTTFGGTPRVYIAGARHQTCSAICYNGWWSFVLQINPTTGAPSGSPSFRFATEGGGARALAVQPYFGLGGTRDDIYLLADKTRNCKNGMVVKAYRKDAPTTWEKVIGGLEASLCGVQQFTVRGVWPNALALQDGRLAAVGNGYVQPLGCPSCEDTVDGAIAVLDATNGDLISPAPSGNPQPLYYSYTNTSGTRVRHSGFYGVVGAGSGRFTVAGDTRFPETHSNASYRGKMTYASLRVLESGDSDTIFADGFESGGNPLSAHFRGTNLSGMTPGYPHSLQVGASTPGIDLANHDTATTPPARETIRSTQPSPGHEPTASRSIPGESARMPATPATNGAWRNFVNHANSDTPIDSTWLAGGYPGWGMTRTSRTSRSPMPASPAT